MPRRHLFKISVSTSEGLKWLKDLWLHSTTHEIKSSVMHRRGNSLPPSLNSDKKLCEFHSEIVGVLENLDHTASFETPRLVLVCFNFLNCRVILFIHVLFNKKNVVHRDNVFPYLLFLARSRRPGHPRLLQAPSQALVPSHGLSGGDGQIHDGPEAAGDVCPQEEPQLPPSRQGEAEHVQPPGAPGTHGSDVNERQRGSCPSVFVTARLCRLSLSAAAVGGESEEASVVLAVLAAVQGREGDRWSRAVPRGARGRDESAGQVNPRSSDHDDTEREPECFFYSWCNVLLFPLLLCSSLFPPALLFLIRQ